MTALQVYKAALYDVLGVHSMECEGAKCFPRVMTRLQEALEAAAKVGGLADDEAAVQIIARAYPRLIDIDHATAIAMAIDAYLRGAR